MTSTTRSTTLRLALVALVAVLPLLAACSSTRSVGTQVDDAWITTAVTSKLAADPEVNPFEIDVDTTNGRVRLSGLVARDHQRDEAARLARSTEGVREVVNDIRIGDQTLGEQVDDAWITTKIRAKLTADPEVRERDIDVDVLDGVVTLSGIVRSERERSQAEHLARETTGVKGVAVRLAIDRTG